MKIMKITSAFALVLALVAAQLAFAVSPAYADYTHTLTVSAGAGTFNDGTDDINLVKNGETTAYVQSNATSIKVGEKTYDIKTMPDGLEPAESKYFVRGLKVAGDDNDNAKVGTINLATGQGHLGNEDVELVVAYGLKSNMVKYTVNYFEYGTNAALAPSETHYGVVGDKPVVSFKYFDGYLPRDLNITGTIAADGSTIFTFYYYEVDLNGNIIIINDGDGGAGAGGAGGAGAAGDNAGANIGDNDTPLANGPNDIVDIDNGQTPTTDGTDIDGNKTPGANWALIGGGAALVAAIAAAAIIFFRRRRDEEEA